MDKYLKSNWSKQYKSDFENMPKIIQEFAGDLFEIKWYGYGGLEWELEHNLLGDKQKTKDFMAKYKKLSEHERRLIYYAYEA